jgi:uncharacterized protein (DUF2236 family)
MILCVSADARMRLFWWKLFNSSMELRQTSKPAEYVTRRDLESLIAQIERSGVDPRAGIFGTDSVTWRINRESALFLGAGRAALLQLAHPWVTSALQQHSTLLQDPIARFHSTFRIVFTMVFGSTSQAFSAAHSLHQLHTRIRGEIDEPVAGYSHGSHYEANHIAALRWVFATLVESAVLAYEWVLPLTEHECATYYDESKILASLFGIPADELPGDWAAFKAYMREMCGSEALGVGPTAVAMAHNLLAGAHSWVRPPTWYRALTAEWMPSRLREEFRLDFGAEEKRIAERARKWIRPVYRRLPAAVRFTGAYHEACARMRAKKPGVWTRGSNQFWIGQPQLPFADQAPRTGSAIW